MENRPSLNYFHTNIAIPNIIAHNLSFFKEKILNIPKNMEYFIEKDTYEISCEELKVDKTELKCKYTANNTNGYFVVFVEFPKSYVKNVPDNFAIAIAIKDDIFRYFTYEYGKSFDNKEIFVVGEWDIKEKEITGHFNYGNTNTYSINEFASRVAKSLERNE